MGTVYLGYHEGRGEHVAIKVLADALANNSSYLARFHREAKNGLRIDHPNVVHYLAEGHDKESGKHYLVMEYVTAPTVGHHLRARRRLEVCEQACLRV